MTDQRTRSEYVANYTGPTTADERQQRALATALDIRKFEIGLYWKRATYFWTFIAAALAGYLALQQQDSPQFESLFVVACLGFVFSLAWYFVNRGSKSWQRNWETQVDLLEDEVMGPLYKSGLNRYANRFWSITAAYHFSPTSINQILGLFVTVVWAGLMVRTVLTMANWSDRSHLWTAAFMGTLTFLTCLAFWVLGRTKESDDPLAVHARQRFYVDKPQHSD